MVKRIIAIAIIYLFTTVAWMVLGATIFSRTYSLDDRLNDKVASTWGSEHNQTPPSAFFEKTITREVKTVEDGKVVIRNVDEKITSILPLESTDIKVDFDLEHRQKGLLWYSTYKVNFDGTYKFLNNTDGEKITFSFYFPSSNAIYADLVFSVNDIAVNLTNQSNVATATAQVPAGQMATLKIAYRSQGLNNWYYNFGSEVTQVKDFSLKMTTNFKDIDFPENTLSPAEKLENAKGWEMAWSYKSLVSGFRIGMAMPEKLQPGPLAGQISFFAPVSLFFFFFLMFIITTLRNIEIHPMNYFFIATGFFAFHLLLAYLVDHMSIHMSFAISSVVSIFLVISYLRLVVGTQFAIREAALAQFVYLVLFSYAFFFKGFTGLSITIGSILTLFVVMQLTGRIRWEEKFATKMVYIPKEDKDKNKESTQAQ
ncbi:MAG: inner membrane CreD family protein [Blastocatellia bacterium]|nr:inner membrane CreD family protein [Blastocatellia bacterium]